MTSTDGDLSSTTEYTYDDRNRLLQTELFAGDDTDPSVYTYYAYDDNGNQTARWSHTVITGTENLTVGELGDNPTDTTALYEYDKFNRLVKITQGANVIENTYDGNGDKVTRIENDEETRFVYDGNTVINELDDQNALVARNVYGRNLISRDVNNQNLVFAYNGHGDVVSLADSTGVLVEYTYDEFGNLVSEDFADNVTDIDNPYRYAGYEYLEEVELYDLKARYYDPDTARFLSADPYFDLGNRVMELYEINVPNVNSIMQANTLYAYCGNNPVIWIDPFGYAPTVMEAADIASHIYNDYDLGPGGKTSRIVNGWRLIDVWDGREELKMGIYIRDTDDWKNPSEYVIAFKGTTWYELDEWKNNAEQLLSSKSADMWDAINYAAEFVNNHSQEITFVGHSKGGAEAASAAVATNRNAMIFNPATSNLSAYGLSSSNYTGNMTAYIVKGDILNTLEGWFSSPIDEAIYLPQQHGGGWKNLWQTNLYHGIQNHLMNSVKAALTEVGYK